MTYTPDNWIIVDIVDPRREVTYSRILAGWRGSFSEPFSWRLSSGIIEIKENNDHFLIPNQSGSLYVCYKDREGLTLRLSEIQKQLIDEANELGYEFYERRLDG